MPTTGTGSVRSDLPWLSEHGIKIVPRTFHAWATRAPSMRSLWDATITEVLAGYYEPDEHGRRKPESL